MPRRAVIAIVVAVVVLFVGALYVVVRPAPNEGTLVSRVGGFSIEVPHGWTAEKRRPRDEDHNYYVRGSHPALFGLGSSEGFHVARFEAAGFDNLRRAVAKYSGDGARTEESVVAGYHALITDARCQDSGVINVMLRHRSRCRTVSFIAGRFAYQVLTWSWSGTPDDTIAGTFRALAPVKWTATVPGTRARLTLPAGWTQRKNGELKGAKFVAFSPGEPIDAWAYVFHYPDKSVHAEVPAATDSITKNGGRNIARTTGTIDRRRVPRLDFDFPDDLGGYDHDVEWFLPDGRGGTLVLAVGHRAGNPDIAAKIAATWRG